MSLGFEFQNNINKEQIDLIELLPPKLKISVNLFIHEERYKNIAYFKDKPNSFVSWVCPLLVPGLFMEKTYIFQEGEKATCLYFMTKGESGFVLPAFHNTVYIQTEIGSMFGLIDIFGSAQKYHFDLNSWNMHETKLQRQFSVRTLTEAEVLTLSYRDLFRMSQEFPEIYNELIENSYRLFRRVLLAKLLALKHSRTSIKFLEENADLDNNLEASDREMLRVKAMVSTRTNRMIEFNPFDLEQVEEIESEDILTSELDSMSDS